MFSSILREFEQFGTTYGRSQMSTEDLTGNVEILRTLCHGVGIRGNARHVTPEVLSDFGCDSKQELVSLVAGTLQEMIDESPKDTRRYNELQAAMYALGPDNEDLLNLTERREQLIQVIDVSPRTLMRYEVAGIERLLTRLGFGAISGLESLEGLEAEIPRIGPHRRLKRVESMLEALLEFHGIAIPE